MPMLMNISLLLGSRYSLLSMRAMVFLAPSCLAMIAASTFWFSSWFTAIKRSQRRTPARRNTANAVVSPSTVIRSTKLPSSSSAFESLSMTVMSCPWPLSIFAKWLPISPMPEITIFIRRNIGRTMPACGYDPPVPACTLHKGKESKNGPNFAKYFTNI